MSIKRKRKYYGKYRGIVLNNIDPERIGRLMLQVPDVFGAQSSAWAMPSFPVAGPQMGVYVIPSTGANVWVEFEAGDRDHPIWSGCFFKNAADVPSSALSGNPSDPNIAIQTVGQNSFVLSDVPGPTGGITIKSTNGASISINDNGIVIQNAKGANIQLLGPGIVMNNGAFHVP